MTSNMLELFWISGSPFSWRVMLMMEAKEIPYTPRLLQASQGELKTREFLLLNPRGKVPTLRDGDVVLSESIAIMQYLEGKYPARPMFGRTTRGTATIWRVISEFTSYVQPPLGRVNYPLLSGKSKEAAADVTAALADVYTELDKLEVSLANIPWLAGMEITAADTMAYPFLKLLWRSATKEAASQFELGPSLLQRRYPRLVQWMERLEQLPGYERTYPPHWQ